MEFLKKQDLTDIIKKIFLIIIIVSSIHQSLFAQAPGALSDEALYYRCYAHMVQKRPATNDSRLNKIRNGTLTGPQACSELLQTANLNAQGNLANLSLEGENILKTFQRLHHSWIGTHDFEGQYSNWTSAFYDYNEMGLYFTRVLFAPNTEFRTVVTTSQIFEPIRRPTANNEYFLDAGTNGYKDFDYTTWTIHGNSFTPQFANPGALIGVRPISRTNIVPFDNEEYYRGPIETPVNIHESFGAGVIGSPVYLLLNTKYHRNIDGGFGTYRRWSKNLIKHFMCRDVPVLSSSDVAPYVQPSAPEPFRGGTLCQRCHVTMDSLAGVVRHYFPVSVNNDANRQAGPFLFAAKNSNTISTSESPLLSTINDFEFRPRRGRFVYRDMNNNFINADLNSLDDFGTILGGTSGVMGSGLLDFYACVTSRYFKFFTGITANLDNLAPGMGSMSLNATELEHRNFVVNLATNLRNHQSLQTMISEIFNSSYYRDRNYGGN